MVYSIFTPYLLYWLKHVDASWNYPPAFLVCWFRRGYLYLCYYWHWGQRGAHWIQSKPQQILWFSRLMCVPPQHQTAAVIHVEKGDNYIAAMERCWIRQFGLPQILAIDKGRAWLGKDFNSRTSTHGILHEVARVEAHQKLAFEERRHQILRKAIEGRHARHVYDRNQRHPTSSILCDAPDQRHTKRRLFTFLVCVCACGLETISTN